MDPARVQCYRYDLVLNGTEGLRDSGGGVQFALVTLAVLGGVLHALLIEGTMEGISKAALCLLVLAATVKAIADLRAWAIRPRRGT